LGFAYNTKSCVFWDVRPCGLVKVCWYIPEGRTLIVATLRISNQKTNLLLDYNFAKIMEDAFVLQITK
jgi:hypothetical protein